LSMYLKMSALSASLGDDLFHVILWRNRFINALLYFYAFVILFLFTLFLVLGDTFSNEPVEGTYVAAIMLGTGIVMAIPFTWLAVYMIMQHQSIIAAKKRKGEEVQNLPSAIGPFRKFFALFPRYCFYYNMLFILTFILLSGPTEEGMVFIASSAVFLHLIVRMWNERDRGR